MIRVTANSTTYHIAVAAVIFLFASAATADPGGSSTKIDQHVVIRIDRQRISVDYTLTMNRAGAFQEVLAIDKNRDGIMSRDERDAYFNEIGRQLVAGLELSVNGCEQSLRQVGELQLSMPFKKRIQFQCEQALPKQTARLEFHNDNYLAIDGAASISVEVIGPVRLVSNSLDKNSVEDVTSLSVVEPQRDALICYRNSEAGDHGRIDKDASHLTSALPDGSATKWIVFDKTTIGFYLLMTTVAAFVIVSVVLFTKRGNRAVLSLAFIGLVLLAVCPRWFHANWRQDTQLSPPISEDEAERIFSSLHRNIYGALTARTEDDLYNMLAKSIDGELLNDMYLKLHRLTLARDLGATFHVRRIKPLESEIDHEPAESNVCFEVRHRWRVYGIVSHSGHRHARINEYEATFSVGKNQKGWRITDAKVHDYYRTDPGLIFASIVR